METWRIIATAILALAGLLLMLILIAKVREQTRHSGQAALAGAIMFALLVILCVLTLTALTPVLAWGLVILVTATVGVMLFAS